jgi:hypothetical protein
VLSKIGAAPNCMISQITVNHAIMKKMFQNFLMHHAKINEKNNIFTVTASSTDLMSWGADMVNAKIMEQQ